MTHYPATVPLRVDLQPQAQSSCQETLLHIGFISVHEEARLTQSAESRAQVAPVTLDIFDTF